MDTIRRRPLLPVLAALTLTACLPTPAAPMRGGLFEEHDMGAADASDHDEDLAEQDANVPDADAPGEIRFAHPDPLLLGQLNAGHVLRVEGCEGEVTYTSSAPDVLDYDATDARWKTDTPGVTRLTASCGGREAMLTVVSLPVSSARVPDLLVWSRADLIVKTDQSGSVSILENLATPEWNWYATDGGERERPRDMGDGAITFGGPASGQPTHLIARDAFGEAKTLEVSGATVFFSARSDDSVSQCVIGGKTSDGRTVCFGLAGASVFVSHRYMSIAREQRFTTNAPRGRDAFTNAFIRFARSTSSDDSAGFRFTDHDGTSLGNTWSVTTEGEPFEFSYMGVDDPEAVEEESKALHGAVRELIVLDEPDPDAPIDPALVRYIESTYPNPTF